jgi:hypothetical protein
VPQLQYSSNMKKSCFIIFLIFQTTNLLADSWLIFDTDRSAYEYGYRYGSDDTGLNWCYYRNLTGSSDLLRDICEEGLAYQKAYGDLSSLNSTIKNTLNSCDAALNSCKGAFNSCDNAYKLLLADRNKIASDQNLCSSQYNNLLSPYNTLVSRSKSDSTLIKKLRKACGSKCKKIK